MLSKSESIHPPICPSVPAPLVFPFITFVFSSKVIELSCHLSYKAQKVLSSRLNLLIPSQPEAIVKL